MGKYYTPADSAKNIFKVNGRSSIIGKRIFDNISMGEDVVVNIR